VRRQNMGSNKAKHYLFLKFFEEYKHAEDLIDGIVHCNPTHLFRSHNIGTHDMRYDSLESLKLKNEITEMTMVLENDKTISTPVIKGSIKIFEPDAHLFCMYGMEIPHIAFRRESEKVFKIKDLIHPDALKLGDHIVAFLNINGFFERLDKQIINDHFSAKRNFVSYYDVHKYKGELGYFKKPDSYKHQNEYRYVIYSNQDIKSPLRLQIGSLKDIAKIYSAKEFLNKSIVINNDTIKII
jgi:hypothetical protein